MNTNLKPCARCGSTRVEMIAVRPWLSLREQQAWEPFCHDCDVAGYLRSEQARIDAWNRRPIEDELRAKLKVAESDLALLSISLDHSNQGDPVIRLVNESVKKTLARIKE